jgi:lipid-binding SYLF domain-containing protein
MSMSRTATAVIAAALLVATPAMAAQSGFLATSAQQTQQARSAQKIVDNAANAIAQMKSNPRLDQLLPRAKGVFIIPTLIKGAFVIGGEGGTGVLLAHKPGAWSDPAFFSLASGSIGPQIGGEAGPVVMLLMTRKAVDAFTGKGNFSLNANAGLTIVNYSARGQSNVGKGDVILWSGASGGFIGASVSGANISADTAKDRSYYGRPVSTRQITAGLVRNAGADRLRSELPT